MDNTENRSGRGIGLAVIAASLAILFTCGFLTALVGIDFGPHEEIAMSLTPGDPVGMFKAHPEPLWHLMTYFTVRILHCNVQIAAGLVSGLLIALTYIAAYFIIRREVPGLESYEAAALDLVLHLAGAIYVPFFNKEPYLGQGTPNIWHNPTTIAVRPIALLVFVLVGSMIMKARKEEFEMIMYKGKSFGTALQLFIVCLPSFVVMIMQFVISFYSGNGNSGGITIAPFVVAGARTSSIPISMLLLLAFPLLMLIISLIKKSVNWEDVLGWLMLLWGLVWRLLLAEKGERIYHGNFSWGYMLAAYLVWYTAVRNYLKFYFSEQMTGNKRGVGFVLATIVLALHFVSGIYYLIYLVALGHGM